ncbi:hypothetical protein NBO_415g0005 [Nosema bombycis CQ1]|uniref:Uncharacterized protein n=1 Tax=Nosema bombycis (strain CQ1 / CVCC 102059) TaxID=578461 RepID=R0MEL1_NOSB1|nr:hypothetical protein NBO_415g0005 [Nosema bombycis CQ1]|eukprot:EOB12560.1 hypothetical protein NBO_415g0005 [Nosema bombycis CQ1]
MRAPEFIYTRVPYIFEMPLANFSFTIIPTFYHYTSLYPLHFTSLPNTLFIKTIFKFF